MDGIKTDSEKAYADFIALRGGSEAQPYSRAEFLQMSVDEQLALIADAIQDDSHRPRYGPGSRPALFSEMARELWDANVVITEQEV